MQEAADADVTDCKWFGQLPSADLDTDHHLHSFTGISNSLEFPPISPSIRLQVIESRRVFSANPVLEVIVAASAANSVSHWRKSVPFRFHVGETGLVAASPWQARH